MLAYAIPGTVVGVGLIVVYNRPPLILTGTWMILLVSYFIRHLPYPVRSCTAMLQQIDVRVEEASVSLGVPPFRTFLKVTIPLMFPAIVSGAALAWMTTIGELSSSILLYSGPWATMSVAIFTEVFSNHFGTASALASILIGAAFIPLFLTYRFLGDRAALGRVRSAWRMDSVRPCCGCWGSRPPGAPSGRGSWSACPSRGACARR